VANVNCRIFPGVSTDAVQQKLVEIVADPAVVITLPDHRGPLAKPTPMAPEVMGPIRTITAKYYPGVPVVPTLLAGATDGVFMGDVGIPTYGVSGFFHEPDDYLFDLVKLYGQ